MVGIVCVLVGVACLGAAAALTFGVIGALVVAGVAAIVIGVDLLRADA